MTDDKRLIENPFAGLSRADQDADPRRKRRAMTIDELQRLLFVARLRPLAELGRRTIPKDRAAVKGKRDTWTPAPLKFEELGAAIERARQRLSQSPERIAELEALGRERQLIYKMLALTGLRKSELASITVGQLYLDCPHPYAELKAADEKNRQGSEIPLRSDLVAELSSWLEDKAKRVRSETVTFESHICQQVTRLLKLPASTPIFDIPGKLIDIFDRDLAVAGIAKRDGRGLTLDVHALRHTFATLLAMGGTAPRILQAATRHGDLSMVGKYAHAQLLDVHGALSVLPDLPLDWTSPLDAPSLLRATGTDAARTPARLVAPTVAPDAVVPRHPLSFVDHATSHSEGQGDHEGADAKCDVSASPDTKKGPLTLAVNEPLRVGATRRLLNFLSPGPGRWHWSRTSITH